MILDDMHEDGHHMMDWTSWGELNWIFMLIGFIIFLFFVSFLMYLLFRGTKQNINDSKKKSVPDQELASTSNINKIKIDRGSFCPNCGSRLENKEIRYCPRCGSEI